MDYNAPTGSADANASYVGKNPAAGQQGSKVPPAAVEFPQRELVSLIKASGQTPDNTDLQQVLKSVRTNALTYYVDSGSADALVILPAPAFTAIPDGAEFTVLKGAAANATTAPTLAVNTVTPLPILKEDGSALGVGDLPASGLLTLRKTGASVRVVGLRKSDTQFSPVHIGEDTSTVATAIQSAVSPAITAWAQGQVYGVGTAHDCPGGAVSAAFIAGGPGAPRPIVRNDGTALQQNDWRAGARLVLIDDGTSLRLTDLTLPQVQALVAAIPAINNTTQIYIDKSTPRGSTKISANTPNKINDDIAVTPAFTTVLTTGSFTGATYLDTSGNLAMRDLAASGSEGSGTCRLALTDLTTGVTTYSAYVGAGSYSQGTQLSYVVSRWISNLNPTHTYSISLVVQKGGGVGQMQTYDAYIFGQHDGSNN